jgi:hypothetical protein
VPVKNYNYVPKTMLVAVMKEKMSGKKTKHADQMGFYK